MTAVLGGPVDRGDKPPICAGGRGSGVRSGRLVMFGAKVLGGLRAAFVRTDEHHVDPLGTVVGGGDDIAPEVQIDAAARAFALGFRVAR